MSNNNQSTLENFYEVFRYKWIRDIIFKHQKNTVINILKEEFDKNIEPFVRIGNKLQKFYNETNHKLILKKTKEYKTKAQVRFDVEEYERLRKLLLTLYYRGYTHIWKSGNYFIDKGYYVDGGCGSVSTEQYCNWNEEALELAKKYQYLEGNEYELWEDRDAKWVFITRDGQVYSYYENFGDDMVCDIEKKYLKDKEVITYVPHSQ